MINFQKNQEDQKKFKKSWYEQLKNDVSDLFKTTEEPKFKLDKEALNVTKRYEMDLEKAGLSLYDPLYPRTKQQLTLECLIKKNKSCHWRGNYR